MQFHRYVILISLIFAQWYTTASGQAPDDQGIRLKSREQWTNVFGGERVKLHFEFESAEAAEYSVRWSYSAGQRRLAAGELNVQMGANGTGTIELPLRIPPVNDGVIFETELEISLMRNGQTAASLKRPITIYPPDPFVQKTEWLKSLSIALYDPKGKTAERFRTAGIPFQLMGTIASLESIEGGILVVGEGLSLKIQRGLFVVLGEAAARGIPVLCLASNEGAFPLPFAGEEQLPQPDRMSLDRNAVISRIDKRLDSLAWGTKGNPVVASLQINRTRTGIEAEISVATSGWPWLEMNYGDRGVLIWCGFGVIELWDDSPTPRFFLARMFESLSAEPPMSVNNNEPRSQP